MSSFANDAATGDGKRIVWLDELGPEFYEVAGNSHDVVVKTEQTIRGGNHDESAHLTR